MFWLNTPMSILLLVFLQPQTTSVINSCTVSHTCFLPSFSFVSIFRFPFFFAWTPVVWRCNSLPLCVVRITTMAHPLPPPHLPPRSPKPSFPVWISMAWCTAPAIMKRLRTTQPTATAPQRRTAQWPAGVTAAWRLSACLLNVKTAGRTSRLRPTSCSFILSIISTYYFDDTIEGFCMRFWWMACFAGDWTGGKEQRVNTGKQRMSRVCFLPNKVYFSIIDWRLRTTTRMNPMFLCRSFNSWRK